MVLDLFVRLSQLSVDFAKIVQGDCIPRVESRCRQQCLFSEPQVMRFARSLRDDPMRQAQLAVRFGKVPSDLAGHLEFTRRCLVVPSLALENACTLMQKSVARQQSCRFVILPNCNRRVTTPGRDLSTC